MKITYKIISVALIFLIGLAGYQIMHQNRRVENSKIENVFETYKLQIVKMQSSKQQFILGRNNDEIISIKDKEVLIMNAELQLMRTIPTDIKLNQIYRGYTSGDFSKLAIITQDIYPEPKEVTIIDLKTSQVIKVKDSKNILIEHDGFSGSNDKLYVKYINEKSTITHYGYINMVDFKYYSIKEVNQSSYQDMYIKGNAKIRVTQTAEGYEYRNLDNQFIFKQEINAQHKEKRDFNALLVYDLSEESFIYVDESKNEFGSLFEYNFKTGKTTLLLDKLEDQVNGIIRLNDGAVILNYKNESKSVLINTTQNIELAKLLVDDKTLDSIYQISTDETYLIYSTKSLTGIANIKYIDLKKKKTIVLDQIKYPFNYSKKEVKIENQTGVDLQFYEYEIPKKSNQSVIIFLHGGPFERYTTYGYNREAQILCELGYSVIELNYRGSRGLGNTYQNSANPNLPQKALEDVGSMLTWISLQRQYKNKNVSIIGTSYGGYLSMMAKMTYKNRINACVAQMPSSLAEMMAYDIPPYQEVHLKSDLYDNFRLAEQTDQPIGIVFSPLDSALTVQMGWRNLARNNPNISIIKSISSGHVVGLSDFKETVYYLEKYK